MLALILILLAIAALSAGVLLLAIIASAAEIEHMKRERKEK